VVVADLASCRLVLITVDDAQGADKPSLHVLARVGICRSP
jgi:hypothetical protein